MTAHAAPPPARNHVGVAALTIAPVVMFVALVGHPFIDGRLPNASAIAAEVTAGTTMWGVVHLAAAVGSALIAVAFIAVRGYLHAAGEDRLSALGVSLVAVGSTLYAVLPGMEFAPLAAAGTGATLGEIEAAQNAIVSWFVPVLVASSATFGAGVLLFGAALASARVASPGVTRVVIAALAVMTISRIVPLSVAQFYVHAVAGLVALWPLAHLLWTQPPRSDRRPLRL